jgi:hypothetical protein
MEEESPKPKRFEMGRKLIFHNFFSIQYRRKEVMGSPGFNPWFFYSLVW